MKKNCPFGLEGVVGGIKDVETDVESGAKSQHLVLAAAQPFPATGAEPKQSCVR